MGHEKRRGSALLAVVVMVVMIAGMAVVVLQTDLQLSRSRSDVATNQRAFYAAEAAIHEASVAVALGEVAVEQGATVALGSEPAPRTLGNADYWTTITRLDSRHYSIVGTAIDGRSRRSQERIMTIAANGFFQYAAYGKEGVELNSNAFIDSYDSTVGPYATQVTSGSDFARANAIVGSDRDIVLSSNTEVQGDAHPGPNGTVDASRPGALVAGSTAPADEEFEFPEIEIPTIGSSGDRNIRQDVVLGPGEVRLESVQVDNGATVRIEGPATIVVSDLLMRSGTTLEFDPANGTIELFAEHDFVLQSNTSVITHSDSAVDVKMYLDGDTRPGPGRDQVELSSNSAFVGAIYAPHAELWLGSNFEIFGSVIAMALDLSSNGLIHYDEALLYDSSSGIRELTSVAWRRRATARN